MNSTEDSSNKETDRKKLEYLVGKEMRIMDTLSDQTNETTKQYALITIDQTYSKE